MEPATVTIIAALIGLAGILIGHALATRTKMKALHGADTLRAGTDAQLQRERAGQELIVNAHLRRVEVTMAAVESGSSQLAELTFGVAALAAKLDPTYAEIVEQQGRAVAVLGALAMLPPEFNERLRKTLSEVNQVILDVFAFRRERQQPPASATCGTHTEGMDGRQGCPVCAARQKAQASCKKAQDEVREFMLALTDWKTRQWELQDKLLVELAGQVDSLRGDGGGHMKALVEGPPGKKLRDSGSEDSEQ